MNHYYDTIPGWFNFQSIYDAAVNNAPTTAHFVELGSWRGRSTSYLAVNIINSGKNIRLDAVDTWRGSWAEAIHQQDPAVINDTLYDEFLKNIEPVKAVVNPVRMHTLEAAKQYSDNSLDFIFVDASHEYEDVKQDILAWLPKLKPGCLMAGDDYTCPGVEQAVNELFPGMPPGPHWSYRKP